MKKDEYINDAFTKEGNYTNLEVNQLKTTCIASTNNKFELDSEGNLTVKSIRTENHSENVGLDVLNSVYPIGSIYMSASMTDPSVLFGGVWEQLKDTFLLACGDIYSSGSVGGEAEHQLTEAELPHVSGGFGIHGGENGSALWSPSGAFRNSAVIDGVFSSFNDLYKYQVVSSMSNVAMNFGNDRAHNNMPPYLAVYIWKRIS